MHRNKGFSLVELMIAISVITLLITVGVPSFNATVLKLRGSSIADALITSLHFAHPASTDYPCNGNNWNSGWMAVLVSDSSVIKYWPVNSPGAQIGLTGMTDELVVYNANGEARINDASGASADDQSDAIEFTTAINNCDSPQLSIKRTIDVKSSGLIHVSRGDC